MHERLASYLYLAAKCWRSSNQASRIAKSAATSAMGFCSKCGEIVKGAEPCKACGFAGAAFNPGTVKERQGQLTARGSTTKEGASSVADMKAKVSKSTAKPCVPAPPGPGPSHDGKAVEAAPDDDSMLERPRASSKAVLDRPRALTAELGGPPDIAMFTALRIADAPSAEQSRGPIKEPTAVKTTDNEVEAAANDDASSSADDAVDDDGDDDEPEWLWAAGETAAADAGGCSVGDDGEDEKKSGVPLLREPSWLKSAFTDVHSTS